MRSILLVLLISLTAQADTKIGKGFWKVLVTPKAKWVLHDTVLDKQDTITVETYDVRKVAGADVARIRWMHGKDEMGSSPITPTQVAVTSAGLWLMDAEMDDAKVAAQLKKKPSRSDPPKPYKGTKLNQGRFLSIYDGQVCMGEGPTGEETEPCADTCEGEVCFTSNGVSEISGTAAPGLTIFRR